MGEAKERARGTKTRGTGANLHTPKFRVLSTVPTSVTAHMICASRDTRVFYGWCLLIQGYSCAVYNHAEKAELSKCSWYLKRKLGVTMNFSEIIKQSFIFGEKKAIHCFVFYCHLQ